MTATSELHGSVNDARPALLDQALHDFEQEVLNYGCNAGALLAALPQDPDRALGTSYAALLQLFRATHEGNERARQMARVALGQRADTPRERSLVSAVARWAEGNLAGAAAILRAIVERDPADLFAAKLQQQLLFSTGRTAAMLQAIKPVAAALPHEPRMLAMLAFALDQNGLHREAERTARGALEIAPHPWAHHALAHVLDAEGRGAEGRAWMRDHADAWAGCTSFLYTHNWWHAALFHLMLGDHDGALALYHERVWAVRKDYAQDQINAVSLLARLELAGVDVGDRWQEVAQFVRPRRHDAIDGFLDLHYAYALARAGDRAAVGDLLAALADAAVTGERRRRIALSACRGITAFGVGNHAGAARHLGPVVASLPLLGGSTVQRQLFTDVAIAAHSDAGVSIRVA